MPPSFSASEQLLTAPELHWYLPSHGDSRRLTPSDAWTQGAAASGLRDTGLRDTGVRDVSVDAMVNFARAVEYAGFHALMIPAGVHCPDAWLTAAMLAQRTDKLKFLVACRPGLVHPAQVAHSVQTLQGITDNRLLLNLVTGDSLAEQRASGDLLDHDRRYARSAEFLRVIRQLWRGRGAAGTGVALQGDFYRLEGAGLLRPLHNPPPVYFEGTPLGGVSGGGNASLESTLEAAQRVAAAEADVYLQWGEPVATLAGRIDRLRQWAEARGRQVRFGCRLDIIARETAAEAWTEADRLLREVPPAVLEQAQYQQATLETLGPERTRALQEGRKSARDLEIAPNLWAGVGLVRGGAGTALVGSYRQVAERLKEWYTLGVDCFVLSGYPGLEEALRFGDEVMPLLRRNGVLKPEGEGAQATSANTEYNGS